MPLTQGQPAPAFTLPATNGQEVSLAAFREKQNVLLVFYCRNNTAGWNRQLQSLRDHGDEYARAQTAILAINPGSLKSHQNYHEKLGLPFPLLSDADLAVSHAYDAVKSDGRSIQRTVVIVDKKGTARYVKQGMPKDSELLEALAGLEP